MSGRRLRPCVFGRNPVDVPWVFALFDRGSSQALACGQGMDIPPYVSVRCVGYGAKAVRRIVMAAATAFGVGGGMVLSTFLTDPQPVSFLIRPLIAVVAVAVLVGVAASLFGEVSNLVAAAVTAWLVPLVECGGGCRCARRGRDRLAVAAEGNPRHTDSGGRGCGRVSGGRGASGDPAYHLVDARPRQ